MNIKKFIFVFVFGLAVFGATYAYAQEFWKNFVSPSGLFETTMRVEGENLSNSMLVGAYRAVYSEEIAATIDHRPYKPVFKNFSVRLDQTFGPGLSVGEQILLAEQEIDAILKSYKKYDYVLISRQQDNYHGYKGESASLVYNDPDFGVQGVRVKVFYANVSKVTQTAIIPKDDLQDGVVERFFKTFKFEDGLPLTQRNIVEEWEAVTSPHKIFSIQVPPQTDVFFSNEPTVKKTDAAEVMRFVFKDPVRLQSVFYNTYGYKSKEKLSFARVEEILGKNHIRKHRRDPSKITITKSFVEDTEIPYLDLEYSIAPTKKVPYLNRVKIRAYFSEDFIFVQEMMGSRTLIDTAFVSNVMDLYYFHPEQATKLSATE